MRGVGASISRGDNVPLHTSDASTPVREESVGNGEFGLPRRKKSSRIDSQSAIWNKETTPVVIGSNYLPLALTRDSNEKLQVEWIGERVVDTAYTFSHQDLLRDTIRKTHGETSHNEKTMKSSYIKFVGRLDCDFQIMKSEYAQVEALCAEYNCYPVFIASEEEAILYEEHYCKETLWPVFHNVIDIYSPVDVCAMTVLGSNADQDENEEKLSSNSNTIADTPNSVSDNQYTKQQRTDHLTERSNGKTSPTYFWSPQQQQLAWQAYINVNRMIAAKICNVYKSGDVMWIQDYHLLLTPSYISRKIRAANIGLFLHVPFPSSEVFRTLSSRKELLRGMLNADHIGFHLFE